MKGRDFVRFDIRGPTQRSSLDVDLDRVVIGRGSAVDIQLDDHRVSRVHALVEKVAGMWLLRDLGSANGTTRNGESVRTDVTLRSGDLIVVGDTTVTLTFEEQERTTHIETRPVPILTPREQELISVLCASLNQTEDFSDAASLKDIASALFITPDGVKKHLTRLYEKFEIQEGPGRRVRLARAALISGVVRLPATGGNR